MLSALMNWMHISNWQLALAFGSGLIALISGGWMLRLRQLVEPEPQRQNNEGPDPLASQSANAVQTQLLGGREEGEPGGRITALEAELFAAQAALDHQAKASNALNAELEEAREEAELILLQLHQVQEELEHYFLLSRDLQEQLEQAQEPSAQLETLRAIKQRLLDLIVKPGQAQAPDPRQQVLVQRQHEALRRFAALHAPPQRVAARTEVLSSGDELVFL